MREVFAAGVTAVGKYSYSCDNSADRNPDCPNNEFENAIQLSVRKSAYEHVQYVCVGRTVGSEKVLSFHFASIQLLSPFAPG